MGGVALLVFGGGFFQKAEDAVEFFGRAVELFQTFQDALGGGGLFLRLTGFFEGIHDVEVRRGGAFPHGDELVFLGRKDKASVVFQLVAKGGPPAFEGVRSGFRECVVGQERLQVVAEGFDGEAGVEVGDDAVDEFDGMFEGFGANGFGGSVAAGFDVGFADGRQRARGESHLHGLFATADKLELELADEKIGVGDACTAPAFVQGVGSGGELFESFCFLRGEFSFVDGGL